MKKILALVLAVAMLSSMAFAAGMYNEDGNALGTSVNPDGTIYLKRADFKNTVKNTTGPDTVTDLAEVPLGDFVTANFAIAKRTFTKGANLVKSVTIDDEKEMVAIKLNQDLNLVVPDVDTRAANLVIDVISVKAKKEVKKLNGKDTAATRNTTYAYSGDASMHVGFTIDEEPLGSGPRYISGSLVKFTKQGDISYGVASLSEAEFYMEGRVYAGDKIYTKVNFDANKDVLKLYPDADLRFINFTTSGLSANNDVQISAEEDEFVYEVVDKKIVKTNLKWSDDNYAFCGKINGDKTYVISDIELAAGTVAPGTEPGTTNPETGANDVVGIAAALAVVSLVAAGAVSLKK